MKYPGPAKKMNHKLSTSSEMANTEKTRFIAHMSHDIRNPIASFLALIERIIEASEAALKAEDAKVGLCHLNEIIQEHGRLLTQSAKSLLRLCNGILSVVQLEDPSSEGKIESFSIENLARNIIAILMPIAYQKLLKLSLHLDPKVPIYVKGIRIYIERILLSLISNGLKFTHQGKVELQVTLSSDSHSCFKVGDSVTVIFTVKDSGIGIPEDKTHEIFERFSRLNPAHEGIYEGVGLGLCVVKHDVQAMGGCIDVESVLGEGSCFKVKVPFEVVDSPNSHPNLSYEREDHSIYEPTIAPKLTDSNLKTEDNVEQIGYKNVSILVVEDSPLVAMGFRSMLKKLHIKSDLAENGIEALEKIQRTNYDLVFMDIGLPDISGIEVTKRIRSLEDIKKSQIPVVAVTGHATEEGWLQACLDVGIQEVLAKPAARQEIKSVLQTYLFKDLSKQ